MVVSKQTLQKIKKIVEQSHRYLGVAMLGTSYFSKKELEELKEAGFDLNNKKSFLTKVYYHNFLNNPRSTITPSSVADMEAQQIPEVLPVGEANDYTVDSINENFKQQLEKLKMDVVTRIEGLIRENNDSYKFNALQNLDRSPDLDDLVKESSLGKVKQKLRDTSKDALRDWNRVAVTEMANAIGLGSVDRIVTDNKQSDLSEVYVYRVIVQDSITCKYCRRFYGDVGRPPKVYKLSTLLANGSNYGVKQDSWKPVVGATHPNTRTSQIIELKPGYKVGPGGSVTYIGRKDWDEYIINTVTE